MANPIPALFKSVETWVASVYHKTTPVSVQAFFKNSAPYILSPTKWSKPVQVMTALGVVVAIGTLIYAKYPTSKKDFNDGKKPGATGGSPTVSDPIKTPQTELEAAIEKLQRAEKEHSDATTEYNTDQAAQMAALKKKEKAVSAQLRASFKHRKTLTDLEEAKKTLKEIQIACAATEKKNELTKELEEATKNLENLQKNVDADTLRFEKMYNKRQDITSSILKTAAEIQTARDHVDGLKEMQTSLLGMQQALVKLQNAAEVSQKRYLALESKDPTDPAIQPLKAKHQEDQENLAKQVTKIAQTENTVNKDLPLAENQLREKDKAYENAQESLRLAAQEFDTACALQAYTPSLQPAKQKVQELQKLVEEAEKPASQPIVEIPLSEAENQVKLGEAAVQEAALNETPAQQNLVEAKQDYKQKKRKLEATGRKVQEAQQKVSLCEKAVEEAKKKTQVNHLTGEQ